MISVNTIDNFPNWTFKKGATKSASFSEKVSEKVSGLFPDSWPSWSMCRNTSANTLLYLVAKLPGAGRLVSLQGSSDYRKFTLVGVHSNK